jgi:hypothetical protein
MKSEQLMLKIQMKIKHTHIFQKIRRGYHNNWRTVSYDPFVSFGRVETAILNQRYSI